MRERGTHTFDLYLAYAKCPNCDLILECRQKNQEMACPRCKKVFEVKGRQPNHRSFFEGAEPLEWMWEE